MPINLVSYSILAVELILLRTIIGKTGFVAVMFRLIVQDGIMKTIKGRFYTILYLAYTLSFNVQNTKQRNADNLSTTRNFINYLL